jgi:hypothetical protein
LKRTLQSREYVGPSKLPLSPCPHGLGLQEELDPQNVSKDLRTYKLR